MNKEIFVSDEWKLNYKGHENYEFVDVALNDDTKLFIDPCLIKNWNNKGAKEATLTIESFFTELYKAYRINDSILKENLLSHAGEQNATRLGYGRGDNGKGNTAIGLLKIFRPIQTLINKIETIGEPEDLIILIPGFAEDGFSDLLTNIIHKELNDFTIKQMKKYGVKPNDIDNFYTWDLKSKSWILVESPCYKYGKHKILLVPKRIIRERYLFNIGQYFYRIILERERSKDLWLDDKGKLIPKTEIEKQLRTDEKHWKYRYVIDYSIEYNDALDEYHRKLPSFYAEYGQPIDDSKLDEIVY